MPNMLPLNGLGATTGGIARKNLEHAQSKIAESIQRLSSGVKLQHGSDDASGLAISSLLMTQSQVVSGAQSNLGSASSMLQMADSALTSTSDALLIVKELINKASNDSLSSEQYESIAREIVQQLEEVQKLSDRTSFNGNRVLGGGSNTSINVQRTVSTTQTTNTTVGYPQGVWVSVDATAAAGNLTGSLRVTVTANNGVIRLTSPTSGVTVDTPASGGDAFSGTASSIAFEGTRADVMNALAKLQGQRTAAADLDIAVDVETVPSFTNGSFSNNLNGWTALNQRVRLGGADTVAGWPTPLDSTLAPDGGIEASSIGSGTFSTAVSAGRAVFNSSLSGVMNTPSGSGAVVHGPVLVSNSAVNIPSGATVSFDWEASGGSDAFDVYGYLLNVDTGQTQTILNATGANSLAAQAITTVTISVAQTGNYKFVFVSGSWDATKGTAAGARLSIDNVTVTPSAPVQTNSRNYRVEAERTVPVQTVLSSTITEQQVVPVSTNTWEFLSGTNDDRVQLQGIAIWGSAETAQQRYGNGLNTDPALRTGALNALYRRMVWLADPSNRAFSNGSGFEAFQNAVSSASSAPDQMTFGSDGSLISSRTQSVGQLVDAAINQLHGHRAYFGGVASRIEKNVSNLISQQTGLSATSSRFRDTDYGFETARLTRMQILQQAATAMLAQANAMPSIVSALIKFQ